MPPDRSVSLRHRAAPVPFAFEAPMPDPIRIYCGTEPKTALACLVLEFSIRRRTAHPVEFTPMIGPAWEYPRDGIKVGTGFSLRRWMIPHAAGWKGRAIYMDADQLVLGDVAELWGFPDTLPDPRAAVWCTKQPDKYSRSVPVPQTSVMVIDCGRAAADPLLWNGSALLAEFRKRPDDRGYYNRVMHYETAALPAVRIPDCWNHLNKYVPVGQPKHTRLLHYTTEPEQPWYKPSHPLAPLWRQELDAAIRAGAVPRAVFEEALDRFGVAEDWRKTNGLHPFHAVLRDRFPAEGPADGDR